MNPSLTFALFSIPKIQNVTLDNILSIQILNILLWNIQHIISFAHFLPKLVPLSTPIYLGWVIFHFVKHTHPHREMIILGGSDQVLDQSIKLVKSDWSNQSNLSLSNHFNLILINKLFNHIKLINSIESQPKKVVIFVVDICFLLSVVIVVVLL